MSYVKTINEDGVVSDIMAVALDPDLDETLVHKSELVNGFTQTDAGENALDAAAGKTLNDSISTLNTSLSTLDTRVGGFSAFSFTLSGGASQQLTVANDARFAIIFTGRYITHQGMAIFGSNTSGTLSETDIHIPNNVSFTLATNKLTVTNGHQSNTARCLVIMFTESPSVSM